MRSRAWLLCVASEWNTRDGRGIGQGSQAAKWANSAYCEHRSAYTVVEPATCVNSTPC